MPTLQLRDRRTVAVAVLASASLIGSAMAQTTVTPKPPTQDQQFRNQLGLGVAAGCVPLLGLNATADGQAVAAALTAAGTSIGNELRAICGPSAVTSASSLGGGLNTLQATKTATQFRLVRRRIDQRLTPKPPSRPSRELGQAFFRAAASPDFGAGAGTTAAAGSAGAAAQQGGTAASASRVGLFGEVDFDNRDRIDTEYESGYQSDAKGFAVGVDYLHGRALVGGWFGTTTRDAEFTSFGTLLGSGSNAEFRSVLSAPGVLSRVCGGLSDGGTFNQQTMRLGGFVGAAIGAAGFVDAAVGWSRRQHDYARSICAIEADPSGIRIENGVLRNSFGVVDDIYAGTVTGLNTIRDLDISGRVGTALGNDNWTFGPRVAMTITKSTTDAYIETGRSTVANPVEPVFENTVNRTLGGPIGFELAFDQQSRTSVLLEGGGEIAGRAGPVVPFASAFWRHEFKDDYHLLTARFAQDRRQAPRRFTIGNDRPDSDSLLFGAGVAVPVGERGAVRVEVTQLAYDNLFAARAISVQARVGF